MKNHKNITILEYDYLLCDNDPGERKYHKIKQDIFKEVEDFIIENNEGFESLTFFDLKYLKGIGRVIQAKNHVGLIQTKKGFVIEILPKIASVKNGKAETNEDIKKVFLNMIKTLKIINFKKTGISNVSTANMRILDIFILMFLDELSKLIKVGLKSNYIIEEENSFFYKGKILHAENIKRNLVRKDVIYVQLDNYSNNIPENKIIKATLLKLLDMTQSMNIQKRITQYLFALDNIEASVNHNIDFEKCSNNRLMRDYSMLLSWCKIFLKNESFFNYRGDSISFSLLFPMELVFESYVAFKIKTSERFNKYEIESQKSAYKLFSKPECFTLRPDIVLKKDKENTIVIDTKWKVLDDKKSNKGISQSDMYQMYVYGKKYNAEKVILIYPATENIIDITTYHSDDNVSVYIFFVDLMNIENSLAQLACLLES